MIYEGDIVATWPVGGSNYAEMSDEAQSDAQLFMEGVDPSTYIVLVYGAHPMVNKRTGDPMITDGIVEKWEGKAVVVWSQSLPQLLSVDAVEADSRQSRQSLQSEQS